MTYECKNCQDSGSAKYPEGDYTDCTHCDAAEIRAALARWAAANCQHMTRDQRDWAIYKHIKGI